MSLDTSTQIRQVVATRILSQVIQYINPKYANIPDYLEFCQHLLHVCPQARDILIEFILLHASHVNTKTLVRIVQNMRVDDTGLYPLTEHDLKYFVPTQHLDQYSNVFKKYASMSSTVMDPNKNLGLLREKVLVGTTLKQVLDIIDMEAPSVCRYTSNVIKSATKTYSRRLAREILGKIRLEGIEYEILDILTTIPELKTEIIIPPRVNAFLCLLKVGKVPELPHNECVPIEDVFMTYKSWATSVGISPITNDDIQYFLEYTGYPNVFCP